MTNQMAEPVAKGDKQYSLGCNERSEWNPRSDYNKIASLKATNNERTTRSAKRVHASFVRRGAFCSSPTGTKTECDFDLGFHPRL